MPTLHLKKLSKIFCFFPILVSHAKHFSKENLIINSLTLWKAQIIAFELTNENDQNQFRKYHKTIL